MVGHSGVDPSKILHANFPEHWDELGCRQIPSAAVKALFACIGQEYVSHRTKPVRTSSTRSSQNLLFYALW